MSVFVDTGVFFAHADDDATRHEAARHAFDAVIDGDYGQPHTSDYVYDEAVTLTRFRTGSHDLARTVGRRIRGVGKFPELVRFDHVSPRVFEAAVERFDRYDDQTLSFTDATTIALVEENDIDAVLSFDDDFDRLVDRIDPASAID